MGAGVLGFVALFLWSWTRGQYRDIEAPKFRMLELEEKQEGTHDGC
jgi:cbb3-type cytochrome oxidase maturation protein